jgi:hypothetical protein
MEFVELIYIYQRLGDTTLTGFLFFWADPPSGSCFVVIVACCVFFFGVCVCVCMSSTMMGENVCHVCI